MKPACREKGKYKGVERMKPDSNANTGTFRRIAGRAITAACAIVLTVGLAGCGNSTAGTVTLDFFQFKSEAADWFTAKAREFEKTHSNIKVNVNNSSDATTDLRTRLVKNREPDVITINGDINYGMLAEAGVFHDFTDDEIVDELNPGMVKIAKSLVQTTDQSKKRLYAIPYAGNASGYIINADVWKQAGEDPDNPPQTWSEFIALLKRLKAKGVTPVEASTADPWTLQAPLASLNSTLVPESEYANLKDGSKKFSDLWSTVSDELVEIYQNYTQKNPAVTYQQATQDLAAGKAAILPLSKKEVLTGPAQELYAELSKEFMVDYDETGSIGKRYRRQDEIGTPLCITYDFDSVDDHCVTVRDRDTMKQERIAIDELESYIASRIEF